MVKRNENYRDDGRNTKFIDSINYLPMRLFDLSKAFRLKNILVKIFPHLFNIKMNWTYIGRILDARYYSPYQMKPEERERFTKWHEEMLWSNFIFNFQLEIVARKK